MALPPSENLVLHYKMNDDAASTTIIDSTENNNGTLIGGDDTEDISESGKINEALHFDSTNDYITAGNYTSFDYNTPFSVCMWVNRDASGVTHYLSSKNNASDLQGWRNLWASDNKIYWILDTGPAYIQANTSANTTTGSWVHLVFTYDGSGNRSGMKIYVNTAESASAYAGSVSIAATIQDPADCLVARRSGGTAPFFDGLIDDFRIYDVELAQSEITSIYNDSNGTETAGGTGPILPVKANLVMHYKMNDDAANTTVTDSSDSGFTGTWQHGNTEDDSVAGKINEALSFDGTNDYILSGDVTDFDYDTPFSTSLWFYRDGAGENSYLVSKATATTFLGWRTSWSSNNSIYFFLDAGTPAMEE